jgi:hypothetical protein
MAHLFVSFPVNTAIKIPQNVPAWPGRVFLRAVLSRSEYLNVVSQIGKDGVRIAVVITEVRGCAVVELRCPDPPEPYGSSCLRSKGIVTVFAL